jgi:hypothetical protein
MHPAQTPHGARHRDGMIERPSLLCGVAMVPVDHATGVAGIVTGAVDYFVEYVGGVELLLCHLSSHSPADLP